jgi:electron transport complex protein RnfG
MKTIPILIAGGVLGAFAIGGVSLVAVTNAMTVERIAAGERAAMIAKLQAIVPEGSIANDPMADRIEVQDPELLGSKTTDVYRVRKDGKGVAVILNPIVPDGYAGPIKLLVAVMKDGSLGGVRVLSHHETPGLGDRIEDQRPYKWDSDGDPLIWIFGFAGKSLSDPPLSKWGVKRDGGEFDQFTGATITPRSVVKAVKNAMLFVQEQGDALYAPPPAPAAATGGAS